jgi:hypothetical protein
MMQSNRYNDTEGTSNNNIPTYYLYEIAHNPFPNIKFNNTSTKETERIINSIRVKNSHEYDGISAKMLKVSAPYISSPFNYICNKSTRSGTFLTRLKYSIVKPLFKKSGRENMVNYKPISLVTLFSKVFEKIIYERLLQHINVNNILVEEQFGFRPAISTDKASYRLINEILNVMNEGKVVGGIFCDVQKAFDCVNHSILLTELEFYGVAGTSLKLIKCYLEGKYQKGILDTNLPNCHSDWGEIRHSVPKGSVLGPLLFLLYINNLPKIVNDNAEVIL